MNPVMSIVSINIVFYLIGALSMATAWMNWRDTSNPKRYTSAYFWFLFGIGFVFGDLMLVQLGKALTHKIIGMIVLMLAAIAGANLLGGGAPSNRHQEGKTTTAKRLGNKLFIPALAIPVLTVVFTTLGKDWRIGEYLLFDQKNLTLASLAVACLLSVLLGWKITKGTPIIAVRESRRLVDTIGWALILPLMLAMLGGVFVAAKTGQSIQSLVTMMVDPSSRLALVVIYCVGMALFTMIMGNAFAAFPVMAAGIALPFLIVQHHANPAPLVAIGMLSGYCGTLMTPMAANYNLIPAALLELKDRYKVIKLQIPTAIGVLLCNIVLMYFFI